MEPRYEIWDTDTGNLIGEFTTEEDALALVRDAIESRGKKAAASLVMGYGEADEIASPHLEGAELVKRALTPATLR
ncbi:MAG: hypothetical protein ACRD1H_00895 [Vicinamibacterales bacterium]